MFSDRLYQTPQAELETVWIEFMKNFYNINNFSNRAKLEFLKKYTNLKISADIKISESLSQLISTLNDEEKIKRAWDTFFNNELNALGELLKKPSILERTQLHDFFIYSLENIVEIWEMDVCNKEPSVKRKELESLCKLFNLLLPIYLLPYTLNEAASPGQFRISLSIRLGIYEKSDLQYCVEIPETADGFIKRRGREITKIGTKIGEKTIGSTTAVIGGIFGGAVGMLDLKPKTTALFFGSLAYHLGKYPGMALGGMIGGVDAVTQMAKAKITRSKNFLAKEQLNDLFEKLSAWSLCEESKKDEFINDVCQEYRKVKTAGMNNKNLPLLEDSQRSIKERWQCLIDIATHVSSGRENYNGGKMFTMIANRAEQPLPSLTSEPARALSR